MAGKKIFQFEDAAWCVHVFLRRDPRNRGLVHADCFSDVVQYQRLHRFVSIVEKILLVLNNLVGDLQQGFVAALQAFDKPACFLQALAQKSVVAVLAPGSKRRVIGIHPDARCSFRIQLHAPAAVVLADKYVRYDVGGFR